MATKFKPSKYQKAVYDTLTGTDKNILLDAVAGSGKSTTIIHALNLIPEEKSILFLAFNKSIVEELKIKIGTKPNVDIRTLHSLGSSSVMKKFKTMIESSKYKAFINESLALGWIKPDSKLNTEDFLEYKRNIMTLIDLIRVNLISSDEGIKNLVDKYGMCLYDNEIKIAKKAVKWGTSNLGSIDFTDMIYLPNVLDIQLPQFDYVFIDECQDLNSAQRNMFLKCLNPGGRFIAVGDPKQAIYGFAGADIESFNILKSLPNTVELPLSVCYRCDSTIIQEAKALVPTIEAREGAPEGIINKEASYREIESGDMVLCRLTAPLSKLCMEYISNGIKAYVKGRDIGTNLINLVKKTKKTNLDDMFRVLNMELNKIAQNVAKQQKCSYDEARDSNVFINFEDKINTLAELAFGCSGTSALMKRIEVLFSDNSEGICLSTIHKSKGLESNRVFILCPEFLYFKRAMKQKWSAEQEANLVYVAITRAKNYLGYITDFIV